MIHFLWYLTFFFSINVLAQDSTPSRVYNLLEELYSDFEDVQEDFIQQDLKVLMKNRFDTTLIITTPVHGYQMDL